MVGSSEVATDAVGAPEIAADGVGSSELAAGSVGSSEVASNGLTASDLAADSIGESELGPVFTKKKTTTIAANDTEIVGITCPSGSVAIGGGGGGNTATDIAILRSGPGLNATGLPADDGVPFVHWSMIYKNKNIFLVGDRQLVRNLP